MPESVSGLFSLSEVSIGDYADASSAPIDDWKFQEGRPPLHGSPLVPHNYHPWHKIRWAAPKIVAPKLTFQGVDPSRLDSKRYSMPYTTNSPTFITDHHIISLRKMVEQLWAPKISAHIHLELSGEIFVKPLYAIRHGAMRPADYYQYWPSILSPINPDKPYIFSVGGFYNSKSGHCHFWNAGASGSNTWKAKIFFDHGGAINENLGNYAILKVEYNYTLIKYYRTVFSQDGNQIWDNDFDMWVRTLHLPIYDSFEGQWLVGFAVDAGDYWSTDFNTLPNERGGRMPKYHTVKTFDSFGNSTYIRQPGNIIMSSCTLPTRETVSSPWMGDAGDTHDPVGGYEITLDHAANMTRSDNRFIQQSVYSKDLGTSIGIPSAITCEEKEITPGWEEGEEFSVTVQEADIHTVPESLGNSETESKYIRSLIGTRLTPFFRVTWRDLNNNVNVTLITDTELYGVDSLKPTNAGTGLEPIDFSECDSIQ